MGKQSIVGKLKGLIYLFGGLIFVFAAFGISAPAAADGPLAGDWRYTNYLGNIYCAVLEYDGGQELPYTLTSLSVLLNAAGNYAVEEVAGEVFLVKKSGPTNYHCWVWKIVSNDRLENVIEYDLFYEPGHGCNYCYFDSKMTRITDTEDGDLDDVMNGCDNCPSVYNPDQSDSDLDGIGDVCEGPQPEPYQPVPAKKLFETKFVKFNLLFDDQGNSVDVECVWPLGDECKVKTVELEDLKIYGKSLKYTAYDKPWGARGSCYTYVRTRSGGVKKIEVECPPPT